MCLKSHLIKTSEILLTQTVAHHLCILRVEFHGAQILGQVDQLHGGSSFEKEAAVQGSWSMCRIQSDMFFPPCWKRSTPTRAERRGGGWPVVNGGSLGCQ